MYNNRGELVKEINIKNMENIVLEKSSFSAGIYFVEIIGLNKIIRDKVVIQ